MFNCPLCESDNAEALGILATTAHFRCVNCGTNYHEEIDVDSDVDIETITEMLFQ